MASTFLSYLVYKNHKLTTKGSLELHCNIQNSPFMFDHPHPYYLDHNHKGRLKPLNQDFHDRNPTCEHDSINIEHSSRFRNHISVVMIFRYSSFDIDFAAIFKMMP